MPITNVGTFSNLMIIRAGTRSPITFACIEAGITAGVNLAECDAQAPSMLIAAWATPTCCRRSMIALALVLPALISRWATRALRYASSVLDCSRWFNRLLRVKEYATAARKVDSSNAPMMNIDMIRVRSPNLAGRHLLKTLSVVRPTPGCGSTPTVSCAMVTTEGDTRGRGRSRRVVGWRHRFRPWCAAVGRAHRRGGRRRSSRIPRPCRAGSPC